MNNRWMYSLTNSEIWTGETFETKEKAITEGYKEALEMQEEEFYKDYFNVGQCVEVLPSGIDVEFLLENIAENTTDDVGEVGDDYLMDVTKEHQRELEEKLNNVLFEWMDKYNYKPTFFKIENIERVELE